MKKLLSALFILGSVSMLANEAVTLPAGDETDPMWCVKNVCEVEEGLDISFTVPKKLVIEVDNIDLGLWCGDAPIHKTYADKFTVKGQPDENVHVSFKSKNLIFTSQGQVPVNGEIKTSQNSLTLTGGEAKGGIEVKVNKPHLPLASGKTYTAHATLVAAYDTSGF